jgi:hypothetical protein
MSQHGERFTVPELDALGPTETWLQDLPPDKIAHVAGEAKLANVDDMRKCGDAKRLTLLICLLHQQRRRNPGSRTGGRSRSSSRSTGPT